MVAKSLFWAKNQCWPTDCKCITLDAPMAVTSTDVPTDSALLNCAVSTSCRITKDYVLNVPIIPVDTLSPEGKR